MIPCFDIFRIDSDARVIWRGAAESLVVAEAKIQKLAASTPGEYLILDQDTGRRLIVTHSGVSAQPASQAA
jgi:hypothetical protein